MNSKLTIAAIGVTALMLALSSVVTSQVSAKSVSECTNNGGHNSEGSCSGNLDKNNKCQENHAGNSFNSKVKSTEGSGC
jgi:hypothetical protein